MKTHYSTVACWLVSLLTISCLSDETTRNPFGVKDIPDPFNTSSAALADQMKLTGGKVDPNAKDWTSKPVKANPMFVDGDWYGRWHGAGELAWNSGTAKIRIVDEKVYILYEESGGGASYLIEARREGDRKLVGSYVSIGSDSASPWAGIIVNSERIDGIWTSDGARWDFRRRAVRKLPKSGRSK